ncbi:hypothetical protein [Spiroplasma endosymbiont of Panzeria rudis]|uniref:hypothetical protein n=1 Tax=Spiroplasma endosymbiont of Panzeria rudis TaxID=3066301 RepID=UPI0030D17BAF
MPSIENTQSNYTLTKLIRTGISPICAMIGTSAYYGQVIVNPVLGSINSLLFGKKLGLDIWDLNQRPNTKTKLINSSKKILLVEWQPFLGLFFGRHLFLIINWS